MRDFSGKRRVAQAYEAGRVWLLRCRCRGSSDSPIKVCHIAIALRGLVMHISEGRLCGRLRHYLFFFGKSVALGVLQLQVMV